MKIFSIVLVAFLCVTLPNKGAVLGQDVARLLGSQQAVSRQIMCVLDRAPCDQVGNQLKTALPEVILRNCRNCSAQQAANAQKMVRFLQTRYPDVWLAILQKYRG